MKRIASIWFVFAVALGGCHADPDDPAGQADELSDPVRRENALTNLQRLYTNTLADNDGDRASEPVRNMADAIAPKLNQAFLDNPTDNQNRLTMLDLMSEMRDERTIPALIEALDWRPEVNEEHAIRAARALGTMDVPNERKAAVVEAIGVAIRKVTQARPVDARLRVELLRSLGALDHESAQPILVEVALRQDESQNFAFNRLAAQQLGNSAGPDTIEPMIKGLFLFAPNNPSMRMNDVAAEVLVRVGQPAVAPLLGVLNGTNAEANAIAEAYIEAVRQRDAGAAEQMSVRQITGGEATFTLGALGFREAMDPLLAETRAEDMFRRVNGSIALVRLNHNAADRARVREALMRVYASLDGDPAAVQSKAQLVAAMRSLYDGEYIPFFRQQAAIPDLHPVVRLAAVTAVAMLANKAEAEALKTWIGTLDREGDNNDDPYFQQFQQGTEKAIAEAIECDNAIPCYIEKLGDSDTDVAQKAAFMLGRLGRGNADVISALASRLNHPDVAVRLSMVAALDRVATEGSPEAVAMIDELRDTEEGRSVWTNFSREALPIQARLRARAGN